MCPYAVTDAYPSQFSSGKVEMGHISASAGLFPSIILPVRSVRACVSVVSKRAGAGCCSSSSNGSVTM